MPHPSKIKQQASRELFATEFLKDMNPSLAAKRAGFTGKAAGKRLMQEPEIVIRINELISERSKRTKVDTDFVLNELMRIASIDVRHLHDEDGKPLAIKDLPEDVARGVQSIDTYKDFTEGVEIGETRKIKMHDKMKALELLGRHLKMFTDRVEHSGTIGLAARMEQARQRKLNGSEE